MQDPTELTAQNERPSTLQPSDSKNSVDTDSTKYSGSIHSLNTTPTGFNTDNGASPNSQPDTDESEAPHKHNTTPSDIFTPVSSTHELNHEDSSEDAYDEDNTPMNNISRSSDDGSLTYDVIPENPDQPTSWFALNCLPSLKNAAIYLLAFGAATMVTGLSLASAPITIAGGGLAGVGFLLGLYGNFNRYRPEPRLDSKDVWLEFDSNTQLR